MKKKVTYISACLAITMATAVAIADDHLSQSSTSTTASEQREESASSSALQATSQSQVLFRANKLIGRNVSTPQGQNVGKLEEIVFHPKVGIFAIVSLDNDRLAPIPWTKVSAVTPNALVVNTTMNDINAAPTISDQEWASFNSPQFTQRLKSHYDRDSQGAQGAATLESGSSSGQSSLSDDDEAQGGTSDEPSSVSGAGSSTSTNSPSSTTSDVPASPLGSTNSPSSDQSR